MGLFGRSLAYELNELGVQVLAVDKNPELVEMVKDRVTTALCTDLTNENSLMESGVLSTDKIIVAIGENMESSILVTAMLHTHGARGIFARAHSDIHSQVLKTVGAVMTIDPEEEMGIRFAQEIYAPDVMTRITLSTGQQVVEVNAPKPLWGKTVLALDFRRKFQLNILAIKRAPGSEPAPAPAQDPGAGLPNPGDIIGEGDILVVIGNPDRVSTFLELT
jgi:trk system potassium uptake protein TrkA